MVNIDPVTCVLRFEQVDLEPSRTLFGNANVAGIQMGYAV